MLLYCLPEYTTREMIPFQERKKFRQILYSKASIFLLFVVFLVVLHGVWKIHEKASIARAESQEATRILTETQAHSDELKKSLDELKTDHGFEEEVRQKFAVARPGEEVVVVVDESDKKSKNGEGSSTGSFWEWVTSFFK